MSQVGSCPRLTYRFNQYLSFNSEYSPLISQNNAIYPPIFISPPIRTISHLAAGRSGFIRLGVFNIRKPDEARQQELGDNNATTQAEKIFPIHIKAGAEMRDQARNLDQRIFICHSRERSYCKLRHICTGLGSVVEMKLHVIPKRHVLAPRSLLIEHWCPNYPKGYNRNCVQIRSVEDVPLTAHRPCSAIDEAASLAMPSGTCWVSVFALLTVLIVTGHW